MRTELFEAFSLRRINHLHSSFNKELGQLSVVNIEIDSIERALNGIGQLRDYVQRSFISPLDADLIKRHEQKVPEERDHCLEMFHFERRLNNLSDARKTNTYEVEINTYLSSAKRNAADIFEQVKAGMDLSKTDVILLIIKKLLH